MEDSIESSMAICVDADACPVRIKDLLYTQENINSRLYVRDLMENLRSSGVETKGPPPMTQKDCQNFSNGLDRFLSAKK